MSQRIMSETTDNDKFSMQNFTNIRDQTERLITRPGQLPLRQMLFFLPFFQPKIFKILLGSLHSQILYTLLFYIGK